MPILRHATTVALILALVLATPARTRLCENLATTEQNAQRADETYNCTALLAEFDAESLQTQATTCPVGLNGTECTDACGPVFDSVVNADDPRRCGCVASGGCRVQVRGIPALLRTNVPGVVVIPDRVTQHARLVVCRERNCRPDPRNAPTLVPLEDTALCFRHGLAYERCPVCPPACANPETRCGIDPETRTCEFVCDDANQYSSNTRGCVACTTCPAHSREVRACSKYRDTECTECPENYNQSGTDKTQCVACAPTLERRKGELNCATHIALQQSHKCRTCDADNQVRNRDGDCEACPAGMRRTRDGSGCEWWTPDGAACAPGEISVAANTTLCALCARTHHPNAAQTACIPCAPGTLMPEAGGNECEPCPLGSYLPAGAAACVPCELGRGVACPAGQFLDRCARRLENGEPCACACRTCPLTNDDIGENEEVFNQDGDCRVGCVRGYRRRDAECVAEDELLQPGLRGQYFLREFNTSDPKVYACSEVLRPDITLRDYSLQKASASAAQDTKTFRETVLSQYILPAWEFETAISGCLVACEADLNFDIDAEKGFYFCSTPDP